MGKQCQEHIIENPEAMAKLAHDVAGRLKGGDLLLLHGDLGAGKTTFTQSLAKTLGVKIPVTSPTFTVVANYDIHNHAFLKQLVHVDLYRLDGPDQIIAEVLQGASAPDTVTVIEWAEKLPQENPEAITIRFAVGEKDTQRQVTICYPTPHTKD